MAEYQKYAPAIATGFQKVAQLLHSQKIFKARNVPYLTQLVPLAAIMAALSDRADNVGVRDRLAV